MEGGINERLLKVAKANNNHGEEDTLKNKIWIETKKIWIVAGPAILMRSSTFGINVISQAFVGHIGTTELAAYSLVFTVIIRFANSILVKHISSLHLSYPI